MNGTKTENRPAASLAGMGLRGLRAHPGGGARRELSSQFERLKGRLLAEQLRQAEEPGVSPALERAAHDAAALAWHTPFPLLVLPGLVEEKAGCARRQARRQRDIRRRTQGFWSRAV
jgi:hypothetical protein